MKSAPVAHGDLRQHVHPGAKLLPAILRPVWLWVDATAIAVAILRQGMRPITWRRPVRREFVRFLDMVGVQGLPAVIVAGALIGLSLIAQAIYWLDQIGEADLIRSVIGAVVVRELAPVLVGLLVLGRGGLVILDELSTMRRAGLLRALDLQGVDPFLLLFVPRVLALAISVFTLSIVFVVAAFVSGFITASALGIVELSPAMIVRRMSETLGDSGYLMLPVKTIGIGAAIGVLCCLTAIEETPEGEDEQVMITGFIRAVLAVILVSALCSWLL